VGEGSIRVVEGADEKKKGLNCIMGHMSGKDSWEYPEAMLERTAVLRLDVEQMCGKEHI
jgi:nitroimidazol reductase NimA-like FMN-containing flavoprotein (pyridoxamine 5'-phosphate oxidase superfamily)